jgi:DMSO/TMAO reductase YedYZ heme-binding membrane subunit
MIAFIQNIFIIDGIVLLVFIPASSLYFDMSWEIKGILFMLSFFTAFLVMIIRPLADIFNKVTLLRQLVIFRKGLGIFSAAIIVGFMLGKIIAPDSTYLASVFSSGYYSLKNYALFAHLGDLSGLILLLTSNRFSQRILKTNWKRVQKLAYVYFFAGGIYEAFYLGNTFALYAMLLVGLLTLLAWDLKILRRENAVFAQRFY